MQTEITVNSDLTAGQLTEGSADGLQVVIDTSEPVAEYSQGDVTVKGDNLVKVTRRVTTVSELSKESEGLGAQIDALMKRKAEVDALIPQASAKADAAVSAITAAVAI